MLFSWLVWIVSTLAELFWFGQQVESGAATLSTALTADITVEAKFIIAGTDTAVDAFKGYTKLTKVTLGTNIKKIGSSAFYLRLLQDL